MLFSKWTSVSATLLAFLGCAQYSHALPNSSVITQCPDAQLSLTPAPEQFGVRSTDRNLEIADINSDKRPDLIWAAANGSWLISIRSDGHGGFQPPHEMGFGIGFNQARGVSLALGDFDRNGTVDAAVYREVTNDVVVLSNNGEGIYSHVVQVQLPHYPYGNTTQYQLRAADIDQDGRIDLLLAAGRARGIVPIRNTGELGSFAFAIRSVIPTATGTAVGVPYALKLADLNRDGRIDLIYRQLTRYPQHSAYELGVRWNLGNMNFSQPLIHNRNISAQSSIGLGDLNRDGRTDLVLPNGNRVVILRNEGSYFSESVFTAPSSASYGAHSAEVTDMDRDGKVDIVVDRQFPTGGVAVFKQLPDGTFAAPTDYTLDSQPTALGVADLTADGYPEIVTSRSWGAAFIEMFINTSFRLCD